MEGCQLNSIRSTVAMELYLGSIIEPIRKSIRNTLYFNSKHAPKTLGEAMQKAQDLHIKHLYAIGEDQESVTSNNDVLPEITINEVTSREDRGWYKNKCKFREHSHNSWEISPQRREYTKRVTFNQPFGTKTANNSEYTNSSRNLWVLNQHSKEPENDKSVQQPSVIRRSFMQIMVNPMQLQDHEFTAWLDRLVEARKKIDKRDGNVHTETSGNHTMIVDRMVTQDQSHLCEIELNQLKSWKYNKLWIILIVNMTM